MAAQLPGVNDWGRAGEAAAGRPGRSTKGPGAPAQASDWETSCRNAPSHCVASGSVTRWWQRSFFLQGTTRDARHRNRGWMKKSGRVLFKMLGCSDAGRCLEEKGRVSGLDPDRHGAAGGIPTVTHCNLDASQRWGAWRRVGDGGCCRRLPDPFSSNITLTPTSTHCRHWRPSGFLPPRLRPFDSQHSVICNRSTDQQIKTPPRGLPMPILGRRESPALWTIQY